MTSECQTDTPAPRHPAGPPDGGLINLVPADASLVVEVGGTAGCAQYLARINPPARCLTVSLADAAGGPNTANLVPGSTDCLVYPGSLDGPASTPDALRRQARWLREGGILLARVANPYHWRTVRAVLEGAWPRPSEALHGLTPEGLESLLTEAGLTPVDLYPRVPDTQAGRALVQGLGAVLRETGIDASAFADRAAPADFLVRAVRGGPRPPDLLVQAIVRPPVGAVNDKRVDEPGRFLATVPGVRFVSGTQRADLRLGAGVEHKVLLWQRPILRRPEDIASLRTLLRAGCLVVVDFDDDPRRWPEIEAHGNLTFRGVHGVQTSTEPLGELLRRFNPNVAVFPNQMAEIPPPRPPRDPASPVTVFFGALNRENDWRPILPGLNRLLGEYGARVQVWVVHDRIFYDALETTAKRFEPTCPYPRYLELLRRCDIGLMPLEPTEANRYKSDLKLIEHAANGVVALASPTVYADSLRDGETGFLFHDPQAFTVRLRRLVDDAALRQRVADQAYRWVVSERLLAQHYRERYRWYTQMLEERPRLDAELRARVPEIFAG